MEYEIKHFHLFAGLGGGAKGFNRSTVKVGPWGGRWRCLGGVDVDKSGAQDFERMAKAPCTVLDLFGLDEYRQFHGAEPPDGWREATPDDLRAAAGGEFPNVVFTSPPCKGFSGLLSQAKSKHDRYQALNSLTIRGFMLALEAWGDDPPEAILMENVPRIQQRGGQFLEQIKGLLRHHGYGVGATTYCCGEIGELGQRRQRYLFLARHLAKCPPLVFEPPKKPLKSVGEVIGVLPVPGGPMALPCGPMHDLPKLQRGTWERLALIEAGGDWRSLKKLTVKDGIVQGLSIVPYGHPGNLGVLDWNKPAGTVTGRAQPTTGAFSVADPRTEAHHGSYGVQSWNGPAATVTGASRPSTGPHCIADPRPTWKSEYAQLGVVQWSQPMGTLSGQADPGSGPYSVADPRLRRVGMNNVYRVVRWDEASQAVTAGSGPSSGGQNISDPRLGLSGSWGGGVYGVVPWAEPAGTVTSARYDSGKASVADPRPPHATDRGIFHIISLDGTWHRPLTTLELATLQGLLEPGDWTPFEGRSHGKWRERIGNAVPPPAAEAVAGVIGRALVAHWSGMFLQATSEPVWCLPVVAAWEAST